MRLLNVNTLDFAEFVGDKVPRYAIASHRWYADEPTVEALIYKYNTNSDGYRKVEQFCNFTIQWDPDIHWLWIDTCCVDKKSSAELQEVINSMFRWYANAEVCFAFLHDVRPTTMGWRCVLGDLQRSVWFNRGWTLQELLAPQTVVFLNVDWEIIGHKGQFSSWPSENNLNEYIAATTGIPEEVLVDYSHSKTLTYEVRMAWAARRTTTRIEDKAYCLLGIFDLYMPLIYGEGNAAHGRLLSEIRKAQSLGTGKLDQQQSKIPVLVKAPPVLRQQRMLPMQTNLPRELQLPPERPKIQIAPFATKNQLLRADLGCQRNSTTPRHELPSFVRNAVARNTNGQGAGRQVSRQSLIKLDLNRQNLNTLQNTKAASVGKPETESGRYKPDEVVVPKVSSDAGSHETEQTQELSSDDDGPEETPMIDVNHSAVMYSIEEAMRNGPKQPSPDRLEEQTPMPTPREPPPPSSSAVDDDEATNVLPHEPDTQFPHAFERWESLSAHWEGLTSFYIRRLDQNAEEIRNTVPSSEQLSRQIVDLSSAGANLFHAVVEMQRLRASSERKFQRWFFETRAELERHGEIEGNLRRELELERSEKELCLRQLKEIQKAQKPRPPLAT